MVDLEIRKFPGNKIEALTMLYLKNQDLTDRKPEEIAKLYEKAYKEIFDYEKRMSKPV